MAFELPGNAAYYVSLDYGAPLVLSGATGYTFGWWIMWLSRPNSYCYLYSWGSLNVTPSVMAYTFPSGTDTVRTEVRAENALATLDILDMGAPSEFGRWQHYAVRYNPAIPNMAVYRNGQLERDFSFDYGGVDVNEPWRFGIRNTLSQFTTTHGRYAEAAKWNRALSDAEIAAIGSGDSPLYYRRALAWYVDGMTFRDTVSGVNVTNVSSSAAPHPAVRYPRPKMAHLAAGAPPPPTEIQYQMVLGG